ncbi:hypothetical protein GH714_009688 [Hevea brasiliensis]|uniref:Bulb-type lectin domain-containing protein n=1 Tax=Hevea brasiliensis TaxID=3981 RepID=A0A6A6M9N5_HEVBR|nr:hypothetical protein GH714_009688 [Hevea brasiliensis]
MWSTNVSEEVTGTCVVQLLDSGNLVLIEERSKQVVWQSFDYPTDTHLPGMKVGLNRKTSFRSFLTSWRSADDPGIGDYSIELNPNESPHAILYRGTKPYWRSSPWPAKQFVDIRNVSFINNQDEAYVTMDVFDASVIEAARIISIVQAWRGFVEVASVKIPDTSEAVWLGLNMSPMDCELECTRNCSCSAYASIGIPEKGTGCLAWYGELRDTTINMEDGNNIYVRVDALELVRNKWNERLLDTINDAYPNDTLVANEDRMSHPDIAFFNLSTIITATNNFSPAKKVGQGGFGLVHEFWGHIIRDHYKEEEQHVLSRGLLSEHDRIWHLWRENRPLEIVDSSLRESCPPHEVLRCIQIGLLCVQEDALDRPTMSTVVLMLNGETTLPLPGQPAFTLKKSYNSSSSSAKRDGFCSVDEETITEGIFNLSVNVSKLNGFTIPWSTIQWAGDSCEKTIQNSGQGIEEFKNEVMLIAKLQHKNLIKLIGCCIQGEEPMLVYEYLPNNSLDSFLFEPVVFGKFSTKSDIFSFRIISLEIITGKKNNSYYQEDSYMSLIGHPLGKNDDDLKASRCK